MAKGVGRVHNIPIGMEFAENPELDPETDIGDAEIRAAYRMKLPVHLGSTHNCKRNCRYNPLCLCCLGERSWLDTKSLDTGQHDDDASDLEDEMIRHEGVPAGLRNLGNTCYVNSFLQIWFHNTKFRDALYRWEAGEDPLEKDNETILELEYEPRSKVASLQALFAMVQYTKRKFVDPTDLIGKLGLNPSVQQDAQEFSKLFVSLLETSLSHQKQEDVRTMIQNQFRGEYNYVTTCEACQKESVQPSHFYELDLALVGNKTIAHCLADFLKVERMTGDCKYFCEGCQSKQEATRCCKLSQLPPILNLQLNRFQFDMQLGRKKKLNSNIQFPEQLDMSVYLGNKEPAIYSLTGVLMHMGPDANHGHYIAHIQELGTGAWFRFSDETVSPLQGKHLGNDYIGGKKLGKSGVQNSNMAYMLVYMMNESIEDIKKVEKVESIKRDFVLSQSQRQQSGEPEEKKMKVDTGSDYSSEYCYSNFRVFPRNFPPHLRRMIDRDNMEFDEEHEERITTRVTERRAIKAKNRKMISQYLGLSWESDNEGELNGDDCTEEEDSFEFIPTSWLMMWLSNPTSCGPIETRHVLCLHENLDIDKLQEVKLCDSQVVSQLYAEYGEGEGPRLNHHSLCRTCVTNKSRLISLDYKMIRDQQFLTTQKLPSDGTGFWVGKRSYQRWRSLAKVSLEDKIITEVAKWKEDKRKESQDQLEVNLKTKDQSAAHKEKLSADDPGFCLTDLQTKLQRIGTNVSIAPHAGGQTIFTPQIGSQTNTAPQVGGQTGGVPQIGGQTSISPECQTGSIVPQVGGQTSIAPQSGGQTSLPANRNGWDAKLNMNKEDERKLWQNKPSCKVKPIMKPPKQTATVKPFIKSEGLKEMPNKDDIIKPNSANDDNATKTSTILSSQSSTTPTDSPVVCSSDKSPKALNKGKLSSSSEPSVSVPNPPSENLSNVHEDEFNADIVCPHGNLTIYQRNRQLISRAAWHTLTPYFVKPITFQFGSQLCSNCEQELTAANQQKDQWREEAASQKTRLPDLFGNKERPEWSKSTTNRVYLLSSSFVLAWRGFVRGLSGGKSEVREPITDINNKLLICDHGGLLYPPSINWEVEPDPNAVMIREDEWHTVKDIFNIDLEIKVDKEIEGDVPVLKSQPAPCKICVANRQEAEQEDLLKYSNKVVFVRKISQDEKLPDHDSQDPEFYGSHMFGESKRQKVVMGDFVRRSNRRAKVRGEKEFTVSSDILLRDFKVKLMEVFKVAPYDQNLMVNGEYLTDNYLSLGELKVLPGSLIFLRADVPSTGVPGHSDDYLVGQHPEQGFKGTGLLSG